MRTKCTVTLGALVLGICVAAPAFGQEIRACIQAQVGCSDTPYPVTQPWRKGASFDMTPRVVDHGTSQQNTVWPCSHVQTFCM